MTPPTTVPTPKPCPNPWCESAERGADYVPAIRLHHFGNYRVVCQSCLLEGPLRPTKEDASIAWNTRPQSEGVRERKVRKVTPGDAMLFADEAFRNMDDLADLSLNDIDDIVLALQSTFDRLSSAPQEDK